MPDTALRRMTVEQFLDWDDGTDTRYELHQGVPVAMAPGRQAHQALIMELGARLRSVMKPGCRVIPEGGVRSPLYGNTFFIPDLLVTCRPIEPDRREFSDPILIVEVLSPSTGDNDRAIKLPAYRTMPSIQEIVLVNTKRLYIEVYRRMDGERWLSLVHSGANAVLELSSVGFAVTLGALYADLGISDSQADAASGQPNER